MFKENTEYKIKNLWTINYHYVKYEPNWSHTGRSYTHLPVCVCVCVKYLCPLPFRRAAAVQTDYVTPGVGSDPLEIKSSKTRLIWRPGSV